VALILSINKKAMLSRGDRAVQHKFKFSRWARKTQCVLSTVLFKVIQGRCSYRLVLDLHTPEGRKAELT